MDYSPVVTTLTEQEYFVLTRPIVGTGGHQGLLRAILSGLNHRTRRLELNLARRKKAAVYAAYNGRRGGGYQDRFKAIDQACTRVGR